MANEDTFWQWFSKNLSNIESHKDENDKILDELLLQLHKYNENLFFELSTDDVENELIITAEGDSDQFESVRNLIAKSPNIRNWKFIAFKPALGFDFTIKYEGTEYNPAKLWFLPLEDASDPSFFGIRIGIPNFNKKTHNHSEAAIYIILDTALGELTAAEEIHYIEAGSLPASPEKEGYIELTELKDYLDWMKKKKYQSDNNE